MPELGNQRRRRAKMRMNIRPSQKLGTDWPRSEKTDTSASITERGRSAATTPSGKLSTAATSIALRASVAVALNRPATATMAG